MTEPTNLTAEEHNQLTELIDKQRIAETSSDAKVAEKAKTAAATISAELEKRAAQREAAATPAPASKKNPAGGTDQPSKSEPPKTAPAKADPIGTCKPLNGKRFQVGEPTRPGEGRDAWVAGAKKRVEVEIARKKITGEK